MKLNLPGKNLHPYNSYGDRELIACLKEDDMAAFDEIYHRHADQIYRFLHRILQDQEQCNDVIQNVFAWLWEHRGSVQITSLKSYLFAAAKFNLASAIRVSKRRAEILAEGPVFQEETEGSIFELKELKSLIASFTDSLPERAKEIFELSRNHYLTNKEIAQRLGITEKTVENQMTITLRKLRAHLGRLSFWTLLW